LVLKGGEVSAKGLSNRINNAVVLAFVHAGSELLAVGGIKVPASKGRQRKFELSGASVPFQDYPVELGWVFVDEAHRQRKLSGRVVDALLPHFRGRNCYASSKESRHAMHATLNKRGFKRVGEPYASDLADENVLLFIRPADP
jgi:GNAT superfamily N-acetyltransferase